MKTKLNTQNAELQRNQRRWLQAVDAGGNARGAKTVVDVHDGNIGSAGIEHTEQRRDAAEAGAVADAGGHGDHWQRDETTDDAGEGSFHSGNANNDASLRELALAMLEQAMNTGDADIVELIGAVTHHTRGEEGFFGNGYVTRAR